MTVTIMQIPISRINPYGWFCSGTGTFMPHRLAIKVGMARMMVMEVKNFMTPFRLLEMMEA